MILDFLDSLYRQAKKSLKTIVLPESDDLRVLQAADRVLSQNLANIILIGKQDNILAIAEQNNLNLSKALFISQNDLKIFDQAVNSFYEIRKNKGLTLAQAGQKIKDISYFATM
ncbi:MAG: phosphate acetyltransferase, partial [Bifidobacteriaceae bacterium]|nr:phosphate acetyltransferase [Bifidobacteriaceae bacterium]